MTTTLEFDLAIQSRPEGGYTVSLRAASGVDLPPVPVELQVDLPPLPDHRDIARFVAAAREVRLSAGEDFQRAKRVGSALFRTIFPPEVLAYFRAARAALPHDGRLLVRLRLPPMLAGIPWELLHDATNDEFLALADDLSLVRYLEMATPIQPLQLAGLLQVVVVLASPHGERQIDLDRELSRVQVAMHKALIEQRVNLTIIRGHGTYEQLRRRLDRPVHILHVLAHGDLDERRGEGVLLFEAPNGDKEQISAEQLRMLIGKQRGQTRLVVLNSCLGAVAGGNDPFGSVGAALVRGGVPAVVAMQFEITAESAQELTRIFYTDLADGKPIDAALTEARRHLYGIDRMQLDWAIPALFLRGNDGALFSLAIPSTTPTDALGGGHGDPDSRRQSVPDTHPTAYPKDVDNLPGRQPGVDRGITEPTELQRLALQYHEIGALRAKGAWEQVLNALDRLASQHASFEDPDQHRAWAVLQQRKALYSAAQAASDRGDIVEAETALADLLLNHPDDLDAAELLQRVRGEQRRRKDSSEVVAEQPSRRRSDDAQQAQGIPLASDEPPKGRTQPRKTESRIPSPSQGNEPTRSPGNMRYQPQPKQPVGAETSDRKSIPEAEGEQSLGVPNWRKFAIIAVILVGLSFGVWVAGSSTDSRPPLSQRTGTALTLQSPTIATRLVPTTPLIRRTMDSAPVDTSTPIPKSLISLLPTLVEIPDGPFYMGSTSSEPQAETNEKPQHILTLQTYWIGKTEVTNAQFRPFVDGDGYTNQSYWTAAGWDWKQQNNITEPEHWDEPKYNGDNHPVVGVSWFEAVAYCRWLSAQTGVEFRLPSEAEWEKAARGTDRRVWPWGDKWQPGNANNQALENNSTMYVGNYSDGMSPYGLFDMAGNVAEWCTTKWEKNYPYLLEDEWFSEYVEDQTSTRVIRGGSWYSPPQNVRVAYRYGLFKPQYRSNGIGIRLAASSPMLPSPTP